MADDITQKITSIIMVAIVFGIFITGASLRIRNSWIALHTPNQSKNYIWYKRIDLMFSSIFLLASLIFLVIFIFNVGH